MQTFGEQLTAARKAKGMTQEALSQAAAVTRQTISSWEHGRTIPDIDTIRRLSDILGADLIRAAEAENAPAAESIAPPEGQNAPEVAGRRQIKKWWIVAGAAALVCVVVACFLWFPRKAAPVAGVDVFNADYFRQETPNEADRPYLIFNNTQWEESGENQTITRYAFRMYEQNGKSFTISRIEIQAEAKGGGVRTANYGVADLNAMALDNVIPANGDYSFSGGWPKGEYGDVGFAIYGTDENGESLAFYSLIEF